MERWLSALVLATGLSFLAATAAVAQPAPGPNGPPPGAPGAAGPGPRPDGAGPPRPPGEFQQRGMMGHHRFGGFFRAMSPDQACKERFARESGFLAYVGAKLELTAPQQPLYDKYRQAMLDSASKQRQFCLDNAGARPSSQTALERRDRMEKFLTARLDALHATRPALDALYQSLTPSQRAILDHPRPRRPGR
jgi:hypothetical protein